ncbi:HK97-gp10 family putative phage morphogenesis protein [Streptococcus panodentis]|uniref:Phage protein n=1 Tax=Streptococcus panodentis TaxID=1581472 RepID=A0ABS5AX64_9STRE|nr:HK97-gp10 family putative phage morphogenesis protein [Streptococcus panodentis]MBP2621125.1 hypothetical protein [Streptococcus panodentis]
MSLTYKMKGLDKFIRSTQQKGRKARIAVNQELNRSSLRVERAAKLYAPWDTGWLSESIYSMQASALGYKVISPVYYSIYVELGTRKMNAQPFLEPAVREEEPKLMRNLNKMFRK